MSSISPECEVHLRQQHKEQSFFGAFPASISQDGATHRGSSEKYRAMHGPVAQEFVALLLLRCACQANPVQTFQGFKTHPSSYGITSVQSGYGYGVLVRTETQPN